MIQTSTLVTTSYSKKTTNKQPVLKQVVEIEASDSVIQNILNFSKSLSIKKSPSIGFIEVIAS